MKKLKMLQILNTLTSELTIVETRGIKDTLGMEVHEQIQNLFMIHDNSVVLQRTFYMMIVMIIIILSVAVNKEYIFFRANNVFIMLSYDFFITQTIVSSLPPVTCHFVTTTI